MSKILLDISVPTLKSTPYCLRQSSTRPRLARWSDPGPALRPIAVFTSVDIIDIIVDM